MREIQVVKWCDGEHIERQPGTVERREQGTLLDLCESCDGAFEKDLMVVREWLRRGVPVEKADPRVQSKSGHHLTEFQLQETPCPEPGCDHVAVTRTSLNQHVRKIHGKKFRDYPGFSATGQHPKRGLTQQ